MNDDQQRERYNRWANQRNEDWYCSPPEDDEDNFRKQELRQDSEDQREEWEAECRKDDELTKRSEPLPCDEIIIDSGVCTLRPPGCSKEDWDEELQWREYQRRDIEKHWNKEKIWMEGY